MVQIPLWYLRVPAGLAGRTVVRSLILSALSQWSQFGRCPHILFVNCRDVYYTIGRFLNRNYSLIQVLPIEVNWRIPRDPSWAVWSLEHEFQIPVGNFLGYSLQTRHLKNRKNTTSQMRRKASWWRARKVWWACASFVDLMGQPWTDDMIWYDMIWLVVSK